MNLTTVLIIYLINIYPVILPTVHNSDILLLLQVRVSLFQHLFDGVHTNMSTLSTRAFIWVHQKTASKISWAIIKQISHLNGL